jgi:4-carboxymuconolactone decarboxylase
MHMAEEVFADLGIAPQKLSEQQLSQEQTNQE